MADQNKGAPPPNQDPRPLPPGWVCQYDWNYRTWFYVNTNVNPPVSSWVHPLGVQQSYAPPQSAQANQPPPYPGAPARQYGPPQQQQYYGPAPQQVQYQQQPQAVPQRSGLFGFGHSNQQQQQQPQPARHGMGGLGTGLLAGGAGLLGGVLLADTFNEFSDQRAYDSGMQQGYDNGFGQGYDNGYDNGFVQGDDMGGGGFDGGFDGGF